MQGACAAAAVLYLGFRWLVPMTGWQHRALAANGHSVMQQTHQTKHAAVRAALIPISEKDERLTSLPDGRLPAGAGTWVIPLRI